MIEALKNQLDKAELSLSISGRGISIGKIYKGKNRTVYFGANYLSEKDGQALLAIGGIGATFICSALFFLSYYLASQVGK